MSVRTLTLVFVFSFTCIFQLVTKAQQVLPFLYKNKTYKFVDEALKPVNHHSYQRLKMHRRNGHWVAYRDSVTVLVDSLGKEVFQTKYNIDDVYEIGGTFYAVLDLNGLYGLYEKGRGVILPVVYEKIYQKSDLFIVKKGGAWGIINKKSEQVLPFISRELSFLYDTLALAKTDTSITIYNLKNGASETIDLKEQIKMISGTGDWLSVRTQTSNFKTKEYILPLNDPGNGRIPYAYEKFWYWTEGRLVVQDKDELFLADRAGKKGTRLPIPAGELFYGRYPFLFAEKNETLYILDTLGNFGTLDFKKGMVVHSYGSQISRNTATGSEFFQFQDGKLLPAIFRYVKEMTNYKLEVEGRKLTITEKETGFQMVRDSASEVSIGNHVVIYETSKVRNRHFAYNVKSKKTLELEGGYSIIKTTEGNDLVIHTNGKQRKIYDASFKLVFEGNDIMNINRFNNFIAISWYNDSLRFYDINTWKPLTKVFRNSSMFDVTDYAVIAEAPNYLYINSKGIILREE